MEKRETKRLFIDVELPAAIKKEIAGLIKSSPLAKDPDIRFVDTKNIHLTLIFLGNILSSRTAKIKKLVSRLE
ncbi:MAG: 2'-5' RNA ligase family protein, partial [Burkholderiales bacterium]